jgi:hypothetical protein
VEDVYTHGKDFLKFDIFLKQAGSINMLSYEPKSAILKVN